MPEFLNPNRILDELGLRNTMIAADFGCGSGGWTIPLAQKLEQGRVYAVDIQEEPLSALMGKAKLQKIFNIETILADAENEILKIKNQSCNLVLMTNILFQSENKKALFEEAKRVLGIDGKILVIEWKLNSILGPQYGKISDNEVKNLAMDCGFQLEKEINAGDYQYGLIFKK
jgi:ubiquinone/menaquinone biosynthesis C-methylase UbiE